MADDDAYDAAKTADGEAPKDERTVEEKKVAAIEKLNRLMRLGMVDFDTSELNTTGRVGIVYRSDEILDFPLAKAFGKGT